MIINVCQQIERSHQRHQMDYSHVLLSQYHSVGVPVQMLLVCVYVTVYRTISSYTYIHVYTTENHYLPVKTNDKTNEFKTLTIY
jgi:hypothetical protein